MFNMITTETLVKELYTAEAAQLPDSADGTHLLEVYNWIEGVLTKEDPESVIPSVTLLPEHHKMIVHLEDRKIQLQATDWLIRVNGDFHRVSDEIYRIVHEKKEV